MAEKEICVLISGTGTNLLALIKAQQENDFKIIKVIADRDCEGKNHALKNEIPFALIDRKLNDFEKRLFLEIPDCNLVVCAGFLSKIPDEVCDKFKGKIINLHPSLLPKFGGLGMYGIKVHRAVIEAGEVESGCSIHFVDKVIDGGELLMQEKVAVLKNDSPEDLQKRIAPKEHEIIVRAVKYLLN